MRAGPVRTRRARIQRGIGHNWFGLGRPSAEFSWTTGSKSLKVELHIEEVEQAIAVEVGYLVRGCKSRKKQLHVEEVEHTIARQIRRTLGAERRCGQLDVIEVHFNSRLGDRTRKIQIDESNLERLTYLRVVGVNVEFDDARSKLALAELAIERVVVLCDNDTTREQLDLIPGKAIKIEKPENIARRWACARGNVAHSNTQCVA